MIISIVIVVIVINMTTIDNISQQIYIFLLVNIIITAMILMLNKNR